MPPLRLPSAGLRCQTWGCHICAENDSLGIARRTLIRSHTSSHVQSLVITCCFSPGKCKQVMGEDVLFVARQLHFLFFFPWCENFSSNLTVGEGDAEFSSVFSVVSQYLPFCFKVLPQKHRTEQRKSERKGWGAGGQEGLSLAFPSPSVPRAC